MAKKKAFGKFRNLSKMFKSLMIDKIKLKIYEFKMGVFFFTKFEMRFKLLSSSKF